MDRQEQVKNDFNEIALLDFDNTCWNHNRHYYNYLISKIPYPCEMALDIGCGSGELCRRMMLKAKNICGIDFSENAVHNAEKLSSGTNIRFINADILACSFEPASFDFIVSVATIHHLPYTKILEKAKLWLKKGGTLVILDIYEENSILDYLLSLAAIPSNVFMNFIKNKSLTQKENQMMKEHIKHDEYMTLKEIRKTTKTILPRASIKRHLFWRYSLVWKKEV